MSCAAAGATARPAATAQWNTRTMERFVNLCMTLTLSL